MDGGTEFGDDSSESSPLDVPSILAKLSADEPAQQRVAVETVATHVETAPDRCVPTVPKLREVLCSSPASCDEEAAYCLAELAAVSADDVAPSIDQLIAFAHDNPDQPATDELLRCVATVTTDRPDAVVDHTDQLIETIADTDGYNHHGIATLATLAEPYPTAVKPATPLLCDTLEADSQPPVKQALTAFTHLSNAAVLESFPFLEHLPPLLERGDPPVYKTALECLEAVSQVEPTALTEIVPAIVRGLEHDLPAVRATAAVTVTRVADATDWAGDTAETQPQLLSLLEDDHAHVRATACFAVGYGTIAEATTQLETLAQSDPDPTVREQASRAAKMLE